MQEIELMVHNEDRRIAIFYFFSKCSLLFYDPFKFGVVVLNIANALSKKWSFVVIVFEFKNSSLGNITIF